MLDANRHIFPFLENKLSQPIPFSLPGFFFHFFSSAWNLKPNVLYATFLSLAKYSRKKTQDIQQPNNLNIIIIFFWFLLFHFSREKGSVRKENVRESNDKALFIYDYTKKNVGGAMNLCALRYFFVNNR